MKFAEIHLLAYGHFTNRTLTFPLDGPNLHLIYGPNEAGKSTTLRAITGFLYDIETQTRDDFIHEKSELRIGAKLCHSDGAERVFIRKKGKQGSTLLDSSGRPLDESALKSWLSIPDRDLFQQMFGLSHEQLRAAGAALANAESDAGRMLFGAALDGTTLQTTLVRIEKEAKAELSNLRDALKKFHEKRRASANASMPVREWEALSAGLEAAREEVRGTDAAMKSSAAEKARLLRVQRVLPLLRQRSDLLAQRAVMGDVHILPADSVMRRRDIQQERDQIVAPSLDNIEKRIARLHEEHAALPVPPELMAETDQIRRIAEQLIQYRKERKDLPGVTRSIIDFENQEKQVLAELGLGSLSPDDRAGLRIDASTRKRIEDLDRKRTSLTAGLRKVRSQIAIKKESLRQVDEKLAHAVAAPDAGALKLAWSQIENRTIDADIRRSEAALKDCGAAVARASAATAPWIVERAQALSLAVPDEETLQRFLDDEQQDSLERKRQEKEAALAAEEIRKRDRELKKLARKDVPTDAALDDARSHRQAGWDHVLVAWKGGAAPARIVEGYAPVPLAEAYAAAVDRADALADRLRQEAEASARLDALTEQRAAAEERHRDAVQATETLDGRMTDRSAQWSRLWAPSGIQPGSPREMLSWRKRFESLTECLRQHDDLERVHLGNLQLLEEQQRSLAGALQACGQSIAGGQLWKALCAQVEGILEEVRKAGDALTRLHEERDSARTALTALEIEETADRLESEQLEAEWTDVVSRLRLRPQATGEEAFVVLNKLEELFTAAEKRQPQDARRRAIYKQQTQFETDTLELVRRLAPDLLPAWHADEVPDAARQRSDHEKDAIEKLAQTLAGRHSTAVRNDDSRNRLNADLEKAAAEAETARERLNALRIRMTLLLRESACDSEDGLIPAEERSERARALDSELKQIQEKLFIAGDGKTIPELEAAAEQADPDRLAANIAEAEVMHTNLEAKYREALTALGAQEQRVRGQDGRGDAAIHAGEAQEWLAKARSHATRCARLRVAMLVLQRAIDNYRQKNETAILRRAEALFERLTLGRYRELRVEYEAGKAKLRAIRLGEEVDVARSLSDGTLDQLFLSLRLASIEQHLASQEAMPLVLDDIFINFDDERTQAGLETLAEFSQKTQVLLLTHHARTIELARAALPTSQWMEHLLESRASRKDEEPHAKTQSRKE